MNKDKIKWDERHANDPYPDIPSPLLENHIELLSGGEALDVACGTGRNAKFLSKHGYKVKCVDISEVAINSLKGLEYISGECVDLEEYRPPKNSFDLIVNVHYLQRKLFPYFKESLKQNGLLFFETFVEHKDTPSRSFSNRDHYLRVNELLHAFIGMEIIYYSEKKIIRFNNEPAYLASLIARKY